MINILLFKRDTTEIQSIDQNWAYNFVKRRDELKTRFFRQYNYQRAKCENSKIIREWFDRVQITIMQHDIAYEDIYNFDETEYAMSLIVTAKMITRAELIDRSHLVQSDNRKWVTSIECINATEWVLSSCIIFKKKMHIQSWYEDQTLSYDWRIEVSENEWITDEIELRWLKNVFISATETRTTEKYRLLILNDHESHLISEFDEICSANDIIAICMSSHSSHLLQSLDVDCFSSLKRAYDRLMKNQMRLDFNHIDKFDFLRAYSEARTTTFKQDTIKNAFATADLISFDSERVLSQLNVQLKTSTSSASWFTNSDLKTSYIFKQLKKQTTTVKQLLRSRTQSSSSSVKTVLNQLIKSCEMIISNAALLAKENQNLRASHEKQLQKRKRSDRQISRTKSLSVQEARNLIQHENMIEEAQNVESIESASATNYRAVRASSRCSNCHIIEHRRLQCSNRNNS